MSSSGWTPDPDSLTFVVDTLQEIFVPDTEIQKSVQQKITVLRTYPDFINYLLYILSNSEAYSEDLRAVGGLLLKNNLNLSFEKLTDDMLSYIKQKLLVLLSDQSKDVRGCVTSLLTTIISKGSFESWPELLPALSQLIEQENDSLSETALNAIYKIYEDSFAKREGEPLDKTMQELVEKLLPLIGNPRDCIRLETMRIFNLILANNSLVDNNSYLIKLFEIIEDPNPEIQRLICQAFLTFIELNESVICPYINQIIEFMLVRTESVDVDVSLQASEFWLSLINSPEFATVLRCYINRLVPILLKNMQYSSFELNCLKDLQYADNHVPDNPADVKPFNYDDNYDFDDNSIGWTLRKSSAAALDTLSVKFSEELLPVLIPLLTVMLNDESDILKRESGILALGAIAEGCHEHLKMHLPQLLEYLKNCIKNSGNLVKIITFWTMSRYMNYIVAMEPAEVFFVPVMTELLTHILDNNKRVQRSALSAFCIFEEEARLKLVPYLDFIVNAMVQAMGHCKFRSYYLLYDAVSSLAMSVRGHLSKPEYMEKLVLPLIRKYVMYTEPYDDQFLGLSEALTNVISSVETAIIPYTEALFDKSLSIISDSIESCPMSDRSSNFDQSEKDAMCAAHDLMLALATSIKSCFVKFITNSSLTQTLYVTMQDDSPQVRQSAFALFGETVRLCFPFLVDRIHDYIPIVVDNLDVRFEGVCNNAAWVVGEICLAMGANLENFAPNIINSLIRILEGADCTKTMCQTSAITFCTLGYVLPNQVAPVLEQVMRPVCQCIRNVRDCTEKEIAFRGLCVVICANPQVLFNNFGFFCDAVASFEEVRVDFRDIVKGIFASSKLQFGADALDSSFSHFPDALKARLHYLYGV